MPLYEYKCSKCGKTFEAMQKFSDAPLTTHEDCGGALEKLLSAPAFQLKGTGWYATDYARAKPESKNDGKGEGKSEGKTEGKGEDKSASPAAESKGESKAKTSAETGSPAKSD